MLTSLPRRAVFLITCVQRAESLHDCLLVEPLARHYVRARCVGLGRARTMGLIFFFFLWTIGAAPSRGGGLEKKHLYGIKATERMKERLKVGGGEKGRIFLATVSGVLEKCSDAGLSINKSEQAAHVRTKWIRDGTFLRLHNRLSRPCIKYSVYSASCGGIFRGVLSEDRVNAEAFLRFSRTWCNYKRRLLG